jgi:zinc protease
MPLRRLCMCLTFVAPLPAIADDVTTFTLENGLQVVVIEDHRAPAVTHMVWYKIGAADEPPGHSGIAHFLEHLMFKGTDDVAPGDFSTIVEAQGGNDNAFTSWDYTGYFQRVAADRLDLMMTMEADRMRDLRLLPADVETEREVILEERSQRTDSNPSALLSEQMRAAQFMNHPYGIPIIGWRHEMQALSREDALDYYIRLYAPNNAVLVVAGDVNPADVQALAVAQYGPVAPSTTIPPRVRPSEPPQLAERRMTYADVRVAEPFIMRTYLAPERDTGDQTQAASLTILAELLGGSGTTSVLARKLQFDAQVAVYSSAFYDGTAVDDTTFGFAVVPMPGVTLADAETAMDKVLDDFLTDGVEPAAFARIKTQIRASQIYARDDVDGLARTYGEALAVGLSVDDVKAWPAILDAVTEADVMDAAKLVLNKKQAVTGWLVAEEPAE